MTVEVHAERMAPAPGGAIEGERNVPDARALLGADQAGPLPIVSRGGRLIGVLALDELLVCIRQHMDRLTSALSRELQRCKMTTPD